MSDTAASPFHFDASKVGAISIIVTSCGPALETDLGTFAVSDLFGSHQAIGELVKLAHLEKVSGDRCFWSMESDLALYDFMCSFGAAAENDEDTGDGEDDCRRLPRNPVEANEWWEGSRPVRVLGAPVDISPSCAATASPSLAA